MGSSADPTGGFRDVNGTLTDPSTVTVSWRDPSGSVTTDTYPVGITKVGVGLYTAQIDTTGKPGLWIYEWKGSGGIQAIAASSFNVQSPPI